MTDGASPAPSATAGEPPASGRTGVLVTAGTVDLFAVAEGAEPGRRQPLFSVGPGGVVLRLDLAEHGLAVLAVPSLAAHWSDVAMPPEPRMLMEWAARLQRLIVTGGGGRVRRIEPGERIALADGERVGGTARPVWLTVAHGGLIVGDGVTLGPGDPPVLWTDPLWAEAIDATEIVAGAAPEGDGLAGLHQLAGRAIVARRAAERAVASRRWEETAIVEDDAFAQGITRLAEAPRRKPREVAARGAGLPGEPLVAALRPLLRALGRPELVPMAPGIGPEDAIERQQVRGRRVTLHAGWRRTSAEPLLAFLGEEGMPVALLPGRCWRIAGAGIDGILDDATAAALRPEAYQLYRPLPPGVMKMRDFMRLGFMGSVPDVGRAVALGAAGSLAAIALPLALQYVFDILVPTGDGAGLIAVIAVLLAIAVAEAAFQIANAVALLRVESRFEANAAPALLDRLLRLPARFFRDNSAGDLTDRLLGVHTARHLIGTSFTDSLFAGMTAISSAGLLIGLDAGFGLIVTAAALVLASFDLIFQRIQFRAARGSGVSRGKLQGLVLQLIAAMPKLRAAAAERRAMAVWAESFAGFTHGATRMRRWAAAQRTLDGFLPLAATAVLFVVLAGGKVPRLGSGAVVVFATAFGQLTASLAALARSATQIVLAAPLIGRAKPLFETPPESQIAKEPLGRLDGAVALRGVSFRYAPTMPPVLDDVTVDIPAGAFVAFVGASGSGKSTLFRTLLGFETPQAGEILFDGRPAEQLDTVALRRQLGVVLQNGRVSSGSILDNIMGPVPPVIADAWAAARAVGLDRDIEAMPMGMHTVLLDGGDTLSGGQRQRLMIARALVHKPRILLFDEATSALDNRTQAIVTETLRSLSITRIVIAHRLSTITQVDGVFVMDRGRIVQAGGYRELLETEGPFADLARRQQAD